MEQMRTRLSVQEVFSVLQRMARDGTHGAPQMVLYQVAASPASEKVSRALGATTISPPQIIDLASTVATVVGASAGSHAMPYVLCATCSCLYTSTGTDTTYQCAPCSS